MLRILHNTKIDFIRGWKPVTLGLTAFLLPALIWMVVSSVRTGSAFNTGIEFTGGTAVQLEFRQPADVGAIRGALSQAGLHGAEVQTYGSPREILIRAQERQHVQQLGESGAESVGTVIQNALTRSFGAQAFRVLGTESIGPRVGSELRRKAVIAMLISFLVSLAYLAMRFEWRFGLAAVLTNMHDIIATFAFIKYTGIEINLFVVGAILTVIGYSLSDTVVVFDRVRELLRTRERVDLRTTLNRAVNETLPRTVMTGTTVLACLLALALVGGAVLRPFALVLLFGIVVGTMSSIYVAAPLLLLINRRWPRGTHGAGPGSSATKSTASDRGKPTRRADTVAAR